MISFCRFVPKLLLMIAVIITLVITPASAEPQAITATGEYMMGEGETMLVAKERALEQAMRAAAEQAGVYLESYSQTKNLTLTKDEISILARGVVEVIDKQYDEPKYVEGGFHLRVTITARVSTDNIETLRKSMQDKSNIDDLKRLQAAYDQSQQELTQLKQQLIQAQGDEKKKVEQSIAQNEQGFTAKQWFERGFYLCMTQKDYNAAILALNEAITIDPQYKEAYNYRGLAYGSLKKFDLAMADFNRAISIDPQYVKPYFNRGLIYSDNQKQYERALADLNKAISIDPQLARAYAFRGLIYAYLHQNDLALIDLNKAIELEPRSDKEYLALGMAYGQLHQYDQALVEFTKGLSFNPLSAPLYTFRGMAYMSLHQNDQAIIDFNKAIAIDPSFATAYYYKGGTLANSHRNQEAIETFKQYIRLSTNTETIVKVKEMIKKLGGTLDQ